MTEKRSAEGKPGRPVPDLNRDSRHYYDVHQLWTRPDYGVATASMYDLAEACQQHKELMFGAPDHRYDLAVPLQPFRIISGIDIAARRSVALETVFLGQAHGRQ